jgi:hypothetical protein
MKRVDSCLAFDNITCNIAATLALTETTLQHKYYTINVNYRIDTMLDTAPTADGKAEEQPVDVRSTGDYPLVEER